MNQISRENAREERQEFSVASNYLKESILEYVNSHEISPDAGAEERAHYIYDTAASVAKLSLNCIQVLDQETINTANGQVGGLDVINLLYALRQVAETQATGVTQGKWGIKKEIVDTDEFKSAVANSDVKSTEQIRLEILSLIRIADE